MNEILFNLYINVNIVSCVAYKNVRYLTETNIRSVRREPLKYG
jgi:hypothetical protein